MIHDRLKASQRFQKSFVDVRLRDLEFNFGDWVFLKEFPIQGVMQFGKKRKLSARYVCPYLILKNFGNVTYELESPSSLSFIHPFSTSLC